MVFIILITGLVMLVLVCKMLPVAHFATISFLIHQNLVTIHELKLRPPGHFREEF